MNQDQVLEFVKAINGIFIGQALVIVLVGVGIFYTIRLGFVQKHFFSGLAHIFKGGQGKATKKEGMSPFQALTTAVAAQVGTGNIVGVATALLTGGPGALFWMWVSAILGMATNFGEAVLGQLYKTEVDGHIVGGPAYYIRYGLNSRWMAAMAAVGVIMSIGVIGIMVQTNSIVTAVQQVAGEGIEPIWIGVVLMIFVGIMLAGGITRIAAMAEKVVPFMAAIFILGCIVFLCVKYDTIIPVFEDIFGCAFGLRAFGGGVAGAAVMKAIQLGVARGLFSNEAGLGSTPHAHAIAKVKQPADQGMVALIGIGLDLFICTMSGLVMLCSGLVTPDTQLVGVQLQQAAFSEVFGSFGSTFVAIALFFFALTTIISWYFFAAQNVRYLWGEKMVWPYRIVVMILVLIASVLTVELVWELADTFNFFVVVPNLLALAVLSPKVKAELKKWEAENKK